ncbi:MAG: hypothetical protein MRJ96_14665 [Nitrospirales bacterium]|nr:hypothetical protein [Nitrospira sp.]MDR4502684.1 hypothetical protein [Nitrospirales bacterium]
MNRHPFTHSVRGSIENLLAHRAPEAREAAASTLGETLTRVADEREALEALSTALHDPSARVQDAVLQSLVRLSTR